MRRRGRQSANEPLGSGPARGNPLSLAFGAGGLFLYSANPDPGHPGISGFSVDLSTGAMTPLSGSPFALPVSHNMITDRTRSYLYFTSGANIVGYAIDQNTGALTPMPASPFPAGNHPDIIATS